MAEVKWIKITTDVFDDEKILLIESLPEADSIIVIWFKLLCLAGKQNNSGVFIMGNRIPYTDKMLATIFRRKEATVQLALQTFEQFGMIELVDGVITIPNWGKHQNLDQLENRKEFMRNYMQEYRAKQKALTSGKPNCKPNSKSNSKSNSKPNVNHADKNKKRIEKEIEKEEEKKEKEITNLFNSLCPSFSKVKVLSDSMKENIAESLKQFTDDEIKSAFEKAEQSSFLKGKNERKWKASFDWLIKAENIAKVLNGNFDDSKEAQSSGRSYDREAWERMNLEKEPVYARNNPDVQARADALKQQLTEGSV